MPYIYPAALELELRRWMRPDAHRFISPDWRRFVQPGSEAAAVLGRYEAKYRPDQPRVPVGVREGGQWTDAGGSSGTASGAGSTAELSAASQKSRGHHFVPRGVFSKYPLSTEAQKVFEERTTGALRDSKSNEFDKSHRDYNDAVQEWFLSEKKIDPTQMTKQQATEFADSVIQSRDPRIRGLNMRIFMREIMLNIRRPRAGE
jgi:hypothetical protein